MKYVEYIYLVIVVAIGTYLALRFRDLAIAERIALIGGLLVASFMYSFRKAQRIRNRNQKPGKV